MEKQLREAHKRLQNCRIAKYKGRGTDSETDQSGRAAKVLRLWGQITHFLSSSSFSFSCPVRYESSGYEYTSASSPQTYTSYRQVYTSPPQQQQQQQHTSQHSSLFQSNQSYSEPDTSANPDSTIESGPSFSESLNRFKTASGHNAQVASWKSSRQQSSTSSHVQRRVEETRTMITQSSQKSYHIE